MTSLSATRGRTFWIAALPATSLIASLALACAMPFTALAAVAAMRLRAREGLAALLIAWGGNQLIGFSMLGYPHDWRTIAWGPAMLAASLIDFAAARAAWNGSQANEWVRGALAFLASFIAFKLALVLFSLVLGGLDTATSLHWTSRQLLIDGAFFAGLLVLYRLGVAFGVPAGKPVTA